MQDSRLPRKKGMKTLYNNDPEKTAHLNKRRSSTSGKFKNYRKLLKI